MAQGHGANLRLGTWNSTALLDKRYQHRVIRKEFLMRHSRDLDIVCVQEAHGNITALRMLLQPLTKYFYMYGDDDITTGQILMLVRKSWAGAAMLEYSSVVNGRVGRLQVNWCTIFLICWNVHNFGLSGSQLQQVANMLDADASWAKEEPTQRVVLVGGDMNFFHKERQQMLVGRPSEREPTQRAAAQLRAGQASFERGLKQYVEIDSDTFTHFDATSKKVTLIDRWFVGAPSWLLRLHKCKSSVIGNAIDLHKRGTSDHAIHVLEISQRQQIACGSRPIAKEVFMDPAYPKMLEQAVEMDKLLSLPTWKALRLVKQAMREVARVILHAKSVSEDSYFAKSNLLTTISRTIMLRNGHMVSKLIRTNVQAATILDLDDQGVPFLHKPPKFELDVAHLNLRRLQAETVKIETGNGENADRLQRKFLRKIHRQSLFWAPFSAHLMLNGIEDAE